MKIRDHLASRLGRTLLGLALAVAVAGLVAGDAQAGPKSRKMARQIELFERIVDEMLVDSPNWLVRGQHETRGIYVEGHGAVFVFDASLVNSGFGDDHGKGWMKWLSGDDHKRIIIRSDDDDWEDEDEDVEEEDADRKKKWHERSLTRQERYYTRGKAEIVDVLVDFGDFLTTLGDNEWVEVEASLEGASYFKENDMTRLTMRVKVSDVRAFADERIDEKALVERIQTKEL